ncbi:MAG: class I SAM-dependent methyltransferase [Vicinamibacterales bacterium]
MSHAGSGSNRAASSLARDDIQDRGVYGLSRTRFRRRERRRSDQEIFRGPQGEITHATSTGYFSVRLAKSAAAWKVFAVDIEASMVQYVRHRAMQDGLRNIIAVKADADRTNLPEAVDVVLIVDIYHHIANRVAYFTALKSLMKPGGTLAIADFRKGAPGNGPPAAFRFTPDQISGSSRRPGSHCRRSTTSFRARCSSSIPSNSPSR